MRKRDFTTLGVTAHSDEERELYTHHIDDICVKGEIISKIDRLEKHCL